MLSTDFTIHLLNWSASFGFLNRLSEVASPNFSAVANFFFRASAASLSSLLTYAGGSFVAPVGLSPRFLSLPPQRPPGPPLLLLLYPGSPIMLASARRLFSRSSGNASSSFPIAVCPVPKRFARSRAFIASSSSCSVPTAPVSEAEGAVPKRSARFLRFSISSSIVLVERLSA